MHAAVIRKGLRLHRSGCVFGLEVVLCAALALSLFCQPLVVQGGLRCTNEWGPRWPVLIILEQGPGHLIHLANRTERML